MFDARFNTDDRVVMMFATQEARDLGHRGLGNDHLILGMLGNARSPLFTLLGEQGLTLDAAREAVREYHAGHTEDLDDAEAATAADRYEADREALASIGIDLDKVRAAVGDRFGEDLSDSWGERRGRGRGREGDERGRGRGRGHAHGRGRGGFGPGGRGRGFGPGGFGPGFEGGPIGAGPGFGFGPDEDGPWEGGRGRRGPRGRGGRPRFGGATRDALRGAVQLARERGDRTIRAEYVLLGILDVADPASTALITSATTVDALRDAVLASLPEVPATA